VHASCTACGRACLSSDMSTRSLPTPFTPDPQACPVAQDDAWERHFHSQVDAWQAQAATAAAAAAGAAAVESAAAAASAAAPAAVPGSPALVPGSVGGGTARPTGSVPPANIGAPRQQQDRPRLAAAALERCLAEGSASSAEPPITGLSSAAVSSRRRAGPGAVLPVHHADAALGSIVRQAKGPGGTSLTLALDASTAVLHIPALQGACPTSRQPSADAAGPRCGSVAGLESHAAAEGRRDSAATLLALQVCTLAGQFDEHARAPHPHACRHVCALPCLHITCFPLLCLHITRYLFDPTPHPCCFPPTSSNCVVRHQISLSGTTAGVLASGAQRLSLQQPLRTGRRRARPHS
jgi:hypothetical protein